MKVLVTGAAGYVGSHIVKRLGAAGIEIVGVDDLSTGRAEAVLYGQLIVGDVGDRELMTRVFAEHRFDACVHTSASISVGESVRDPLLYYTNNSARTIELIERCARAGVHRFVYSSTAAVYGAGGAGEFDERAPTAPINPYGRSKLVGEWALRDVAAATALRYVTLRYFNVAGADPDGELGPSEAHGGHIVKAAAACAAGRRDRLQIFGTDYETPDGTCVRDYVHVDDLARAHLAALRYLVRGEESVTLNCGYGRGYSVREVVEAMREVSSVRFRVEDAPRRCGDPPRLVARADAIRRVLDWKPRHEGLAPLLRSALNWERQLAAESSCAEAVAGALDPRVT